MNLTIQPATKDDAPIILQFIRELAEFEKLAHAVVATEAKISEALFGPRPYAEAQIAWLDGKAVGFALYFHTFSTFLAQPGIYLEDLYVTPSCRGKGVGKALLKELAEIAVERNCGRVEWAVLNWNEKAIEFYKSLGAGPKNEWTVYRLTGEELNRLGGK